MPTELVNLELEELSLVDMGDDPLAKVALFKRSPEGENMEEETQKGISIEIEIKSPEEEAMEMQVEAQQEAQQLMMKADMCENCTDSNCKGCEGKDMMEADKAGCGDKPMRKSWKAEALELEEVNKMLLEEIETYKAKINELEAEAIEKAKPKEDMIEVDGEMIAKSAVPAPVLKKLEELQKAAEKAELCKRADELLPNLKGTSEERGELLKAVGNSEALLAILKAADAAMAGAFEEIGKEKAADFLTAQEELDALIQQVVDEKGISKHKATAEVTATAKGKALYKQVMKDRK